MDNNNINMGYPVRLWLHVRSEENAHEYDWGDVPVYTLSFYKDTVLPVPPFIGLQIKNYYKNLLITNITVELLDDHGENTQVFCYFDDIVLPKEEIESDISEIRQDIERDRWWLDSDSKVPGMPEDQHY